MKFSKSFLAALIALPFAALTPTEAEAAPRCKLYSKVISGYEGSSITSAKVCRDDDNRWYFEKLRGSGETRAKLAEHIYYDLRKKGYGILVDYIDYDGRLTHRYTNHYEHRYNDHYPRGYHAARYNAHNRAHQYDCPHERQSKHNKYESKKRTYH